MIIDDVATQANSLLIHPPDAITDFKIKALGLDSLMDDIIITDELGGLQFRKPCDIAFRIMQNRWRISFEQIVYAGDNPNKDFQAPKQLGMRWKYFANEDGLYFTENQNILCVVS